MISEKKTGLKIAVRNGFAGLDKLISTDRLKPNHAEARGQNFQTSNADPAVVAWW